MFSIARLALALWIVTIAAAGFLFLRGHTEKGDDGRTAVILDPAERDFVLAEMRGLLTSAQGVMQGLSDQDLGAVEQAARASGMAVSHTVPPALILKLPIEFKQAGFAMHGGFDQIAMAARDQETPEMIQARLAALLNECVACHQLYRLTAR